MKATVAVSAAILLTACAMHPASGIADPFRVEEVDVSDGVDRLEAQRLAFRYFEEFHGNCGGLDFAKETASAWCFRAVVGFAATPFPEIVVRKDGSKISQRGSPVATYSNGLWRYRGRNFLNLESKG